MHKSSNRFFLYLSIVMVYLAFGIFFLRYFVAIPILYSLNDFFWFSSFILLTAFIVQKTSWSQLWLFLLATLELLILCGEEYSQQFRKGIVYNATYDIRDIQIYILAFALTLTFIYGYQIYQKRKSKNTVK